MTARVTKRISLVLIDDNPLARGGVLPLIRSQSGFHILVASAKVEAALHTVRETKPDLVLLNLRRQGGDSLTLAGAVHGEVPESRVIIMGAEPLQEDVARLVRAGVSGFLMADASFDTFRSTVLSVAQGIQVLPRQLTGVLFAQLKEISARGKAKQPPSVKRLTTRERIVTDLIAQGLSNKEIAAGLQIALHAVKGHVHRVLSKLAVNSRLEVAAFSRNGALVPSG